METRHDLEHTTERLTEGLRCPWKWGHTYRFCRTRLFLELAPSPDTMPSQSTPMCPLSRHIGGVPQGSVLGPVLLVLACRGDSAYRAAAAVGVSTSACRHPN